MSQDILREKSYSVALDICKTMFELQKEKKEFSLTKQIIRSISSVGANLEEAKGAQTRKDFILKFSIAYKEAIESKYWLALLRDLGLVEKELANDYITRIEELLRIIAKSKITARKKL